MTSKERWLSSITLMLSLLPFILVAGSIQMLPDVIEIPTLVATETPVTISKYGYLYLGLFGVVPALLVIVSRILRAQNLVARNFMFMNFSALALAVVFLFVSAYGMIYQIRLYDIDLFMTFDFFGGSAVVFSLIFGLASNFMPRLRRNYILGLKNRYTVNDNRIWVKVHHVAADVYMFTLFAFAIFSSALSIWIEFRYGWIHLLLWVLTVFGLVLWGRLYSRSLYIKMKRTDRVPQ